MATDDLEKAMRHAELLIVGVPTTAMRATVHMAREWIHPWIPIVSLSKGLEQGSLVRMTEVIADEVPGHPVAALTGPNIAREIMAGQAAASVIATEDLKVAQAIQAVLTRGLFRIYTNHDVIGCELGGALKNVVAIACGIAQGLGVGDNTRAMVMTRGLAELSRLGVAMGGEAQTFAGLAGMGDLVTTCLSPFSRNRTVGEQLGLGKTLPEITGVDEHGRRGPEDRRHVARARRALRRRHARARRDLPRRARRIRRRGRLPRAAQHGARSRDGARLTPADIRVFRCSGVFRAGGPRTKHSDGRRRRCPARQRSTDRYGGPMTVDQDEDLAGLQLAGRAVAEARDAMLAAAAPGVSTAELDAVGREVLDRHGARAGAADRRLPGGDVREPEPARPPTASRRPIGCSRDGDLVNVDVSAELHGYWADTGRQPRRSATCRSQARRLLDATRLANRDAVAAARAGEPLRHIGRAVAAAGPPARLLGDREPQRPRHRAQPVGAAERAAAGRTAATAPGCGRASCSPSSRSCPTGATWADEAADGWTLVTPGHLTAQFEHTVVVTNGEPLVLTA